MKIAVVIPAYHEDPLVLQKCLFSITIARIYCPCEVNVYVAKDIKGIGTARNSGASKTTEEILVFVDADCTVSPTFLKEVYEKASIPRGGYGNPWLLRQILARLQGSPEQHPTAAERLTTAREHLALFLDTYGPARTLDHMRKHLCWYTHGLPNAALFRQNINRTHSVAELIQLLTDFEAAAA